MTLLYNYFKMFNHKRLKLKRAELGLTLEELSQMLGLSNSSPLSLWENGKRTPNVHTMGKLARVLGEPIDFFFDLRVASRETLQKRTAHQNHD